MKSLRPGNTHLNTLRYLPMAVAMALLAACGGGGGGGSSSGGTPPSVALQIESTSPGEPGVIATASRTAQVEVVFATPLRGDTDAATALTLLLRGTSLVDGQASFDGDRTLTFAPDALLALDASYSVVVKGGVDGVADVDGHTLSNDYTWRFHTSVGGWDASFTTVSTTSANDSPVVAMDDQGRVVVLWHKSSPVDAIGSSRFDGTSWGAAASLAAGFMPRVAVTGDGFFYAAPSDNGASDAMAAGYCSWASSSCDEDDTLSGSLLGRIDAVDIAASADGSAVVAWRQLNRIYLSRYDATTGTWSAHQDQELGKNPSVVMDESGRALVVWRHTSGANSYIRGNQYRDGAWLGKVDLDTSTDSTPFYAPRLAVDARGADGGTAVVWAQSKADGTDIKALRGYSLADDISAWTLKTVDHATGTTDPKVQAAVGIRPMLAWQQLADDSKYHVYTAEKGPGSSWLAAVDQGAVEGASPSPQVAMDKSHNGFLVWVSTDPSANSTLYVKRKTTTVDWGAAEKLGEVPVSATTLSDPHLAINASGVAVVVLKNSQGNILTKRYE